MNFKFLLHHSRLIPEEELILFPTTNQVPSLHFIRYWPFLLSVNFSIRYQKFTYCLLYLYLWKNKRTNPIGRIIVSEYASIILTTELDMRRNGLEKMRAGVSCEKWVSRVRKCVLIFFERVFYEPFDVKFVIESHLFHSIQPEVRFNAVSLIFLVKIVFIQCLQNLPASSRAIPSILAWRFEVMFFVLSLHFFDVALFLLD